MSESDHSRLLLFPASRRTRLWSAAGILVASLAIFLAGDGTYGITYDEPIYQSKAIQALDWLGLAVTSPSLAASREGVDLYWQAKDQHPGFYKLWTAICTVTVGPLAASGEQMRAGTNLLAALCIAAVYLFASGVWGNAAGWCAALSLLLMPRVFAHSHLAALDAPIMAMSFLTVASAWMVVTAGDARGPTAQDATPHARSASKPWLWAALCGALWGLALGTKLNAFFVPFIVLPWALLFARKHLLKLALGLAILGPLTFWITWPWLWYETVPRFIEYFEFHLHHYPVSVMYFGQYCTLAPWHYAPVMLAITTPPVILALAAVGVGRLRVFGRSARSGRDAGCSGPRDEEERRSRSSLPVSPLRDGEGPGVRKPLPARYADSRTQAPALEQSALALTLWAFAINIGPLLLPSTPKYGGVRLFLPVFPYLAILAGVGFAMVVKRMIARVSRASGLEAGVGAAPTGASAFTKSAGKLTALALVLAMLGPLAAVAKFGPYHLSYYNALIGGLPGAVRAGMEPTYWGDTYLSASLWLARNAPQGATVWIDPVGFESTVRLFELMPMRPDIRTTAGPDGFGEADFAVTQNKAIEFSEPARELVASRQPVYTDGVDGVPLVMVFDLR